MSRYLFATYADKKYIPYLKNCIEGCRTFFHQTPVIYSFDRETFEFAHRNKCQAEILSFEKLEKHIASLKILCEAQEDYVIMIDADCWPLHPLSLPELVKKLSLSEYSGLGDVGCMDIPYLFKSRKREDLFEYIHKTFKLFPNFAKKWCSSELISSSVFSTGCIVDLPLLYGGFAIYKRRDFCNLTIPEWIYSADIWLSIYAIENNLRFMHWKQFQFNREMEDSKYFFHLAGPKPNPNVIVSYIHNYMEYLDKRK